MGDEMKFKTVRPYGMLYSQGREYFLLSPHPIAKAESWERDNAYRWAVVPKHNPQLNLDAHDVYFPHARHIVTTAFVVEYSPDMPEVTYVDLGEYDLAEQEWNVKADYEFTLDDLNQVLADAEGGA